MCKELPTYTVVIQGDISTYAVSVKAEYFTEKNGTLFFHVPGGAPIVASFRNWEYVIREENK